MKPIEFYYCLECPRFTQDIHPSVLDPTFY